MDTATVVADHASEGAAAVRGGVGRVVEVMEFGGLAKAVEDDARLDACKLCGWIDGGEGVHVTGIVEDHGHVGALAGQAGSSAARQHGGACGTAGSQGGFDVGGIAGQDDADGELAVVGGIGSVEGAGAEVELDVAAEGGLKQRFELAVSGEALMIERRLVGQNRKRRISHGVMVARRGGAMDL